jgi:alkylation response protein AidB-like acyl-CoA dehydrogenase
MDFRFSEEEEAFREEVRRFIREHYTAEVRAQCDRSFQVGPAARDFVRKLGERGWLSDWWPVEFGGRGKDPIFLFILGDELGRAGAPGVDATIGQIAPVLMRHGSPAQQAFFLPQIARGELQFCLGYSEPEAGSDLANLQLRAVRDGDDYILNGQKRFTTGAHAADWCWLAARSNPDVPKHRGISIFLVDMKSPGISHRPLWCLGGERTNEVYYDNVRVPADLRVGEEGRGWYTVAEALDFERSYQRPAGPILGAFDALLRWARAAERDGRPVRRDPRVRHAVARLAIETEIAHLHTYRAVAAGRKGLVPTIEASMNKLWGSALLQRIGHTGVDLMGLYGQLRDGSPYVEADGALEELIEGSVVRTITAGANEIQKNIIAKRALGLPG